jgi:peptidyl-prolyl cis-trans isomerase D
LCYTCTFLFTEWRQLLSMLDIMRRQKQLKLILWVVIAGLALGMVLFFVPSGNMGGEEIDSSAATVDGNSVPMREYLNAYRGIVDRLRKNQKTPMDAETLKSMDFPKKVLDELITRKINVVLAKRFGIEVSPAEIRQAVQSYPSFQYQGQFIGVDNYKSILAQNNYTVVEFEEGISQQLLAKKLHEILTDSLDVSDRDLREEFSRTNQKTQVDYVLFRKDEYKKRAKLTEAELKSYFEAHKDQYPVMEKRRAQFLVVPAGQFLSSMPVSDRELELEWSKYPKEETIQAAHILFKVAAGVKDTDIKTKAEEILKRAKAGEDFAALATKYSEDKGSAAKGGYLGPIRRKMMVKEFEDAAFALKPGEMSGLVRSQYGFHIIKLISRDAPTLESKRTTLMTMIQARKAQEIAKEKVEKAIQLLGKQKDFSQVIGQLGVKADIKEPAAIAKTDNPFNFGVSQAMRDEIFEMKELNSIGKVVASIEGYAVPKLIEVQLPHPGDFATQRSNVEKDYAEVKAKELMQVEAQKLSQEASKQSSLEKAAKGMGLTLKKSQEFSLTGTPDAEIGANTPFNKAAFELEVGAISAPQTIYENVSVFQVKSRTPFIESAYQKEKGELRMKLLQSKQEPYFQDYFRKVSEDLEKTRKIQINPKAIEQASRIF